MADRTEFGAELRQIRRERGLTQEGLAQLVPCSVESIRKIERGTRHPSARVAMRLATLLKVAPPQRAAFVRRARGDALATRSAPDTAESQAGDRLPVPISRLFGRDALVARVAAALAGGDTRLITLTGMGGVGKTQLALHVAHQLRSRYPNRSIFVDLAPVRDAATVINAIAERVGVPESGLQPLLTRLIDMLRWREYLLVLDNCEHVLAAGDLVSELLRSCAGLRLLATSRVRLDLYGEAVVRVEPLPVPSEWVNPAAEHGAAIQLFVARARAANHEFALSAANFADVAAICRRVGGLPLAIELAAARIRHTNSVALVTQLDPALPVLTDGPRDLPARMQSVRAAIAWSYALLLPDGQRLFRALGVFVGGGTRDAVQQVCATGQSAQAISLLLTTLHEHHLIQLESAASGSPRLTMLELLREYALEQLEQRGEAQAARDRHAAYYAALAAQAEPWLRRAEQLEWLARLTIEQANLRAALGWCFSAGGDAALGIKLAADLGWYWWLHNQCHEGVEWLKRAMHHAPGRAPAERARLCYLASALAITTGTYADGERWANEAALSATSAHDAVALAWANALLGLHAAYQGDAGRSTELLREAIRLGQQADAVWLVTVAYWNLATIELQTAIAIMPIQEVLTSAEQLGERGNIIGLRLVASWQSFLADDLPGAIATLEAAVRLGQTLADRRMLAIVELSLGCCYAEQGAPSAALAHYESCAEHARRIGDEVLGMLIAYHRERLRLAEGDRALAYGLFRDGAVRAQVAQQPLAVAICLLGLAQLDPASECSATILSAITQPFQHGDTMPNPFIQRDYRRALAHVKRALAADRFADAWHAGHQLSFERAVALALGER